MKVVHVTTISMTLPFLAGQIEFLRQHGHEVHVVSSPDQFLADFAASTHSTFHGVPMTRRISPLADTVTLWRLVRLFRGLRPDVVHGHTPKGGMLAMIAALLARAPVRFYTIHGLPFAAAAGVKRTLLRACEWVSCSLAHVVFAVSRSMCDIARSERLAQPAKIRMLANGSVGGVDAASRFNPELHGDAGHEWRAVHDIDATAFVLTFVGRLTLDKGVAELAEAWQKVRGDDPRIYLVVVGPLDTTDPRLLQVVTQWRSDPRVRLVGLDWNIPPIFAASSAFCLPSYREGFPVTVLEAAAMRLPTIVTAVPGCLDAVQDGVTGTVVPARDPAALAGAILRYVHSPALTLAHGAAARRWVEAAFQPQPIWRETLTFYEQALNAAHGRAETTTGVYRAVAKRTVDLALAAVLLLALLPLLVCVGILVRAVMGNPVLFTQLRPGRNGKPFHLVKFRTMRAQTGEARTDAERLTGLGRLLRATSIDELPELWNVVKGEMSLVGPRPLLMQYLAHYTPQQARRHEVRPGITGLAQISGRNALGWEEKFALDVHYVDHCSFALDLKILASTVWQVAARRGISQPGHVTASEFMGKARS